MHKPHLSPRHQNTKGFTLIELMVAISIMALIALMGWRALDGMQRANTQTQSHTDAVLALDTTWRGLLTEVEALRSKQKAANTEMAAMKKGSPEFIAKVQEMKAVSAEAKAREEGLKSLEEVLGRGKPLRKWIAYLGDSEQRLDSGVEIGFMLDADAFPAIGFSERDKIGQAVGIAFRIAALICQFLPLADHAHPFIVQDEDFDRQTILGRGCHFLNIHLDRCFACDIDNQRVRITHLCTDRCGQAIAHGSQAAGSYQTAGLRVVEIES